MPIFMMLSPVECLRLDRPLVGPSLRSQRGRDRGETAAALLEVDASDLAVAFGKHGHVALGLREQDGAEAGLELGNRESAWAAATRPAF